MQNARGTDYGDIYTMLEDLMRNAGIAIYQAKQGAGVRRRLRALLAVTVLKTSK